MTPIGNEIDKLCKEGEKVIESEAFAGLNYLIKDGQLVLISESNGTFSFAIKCFDDLTKEIKEILDVWRNINTQKCFVTRVEKRKMKRKRKQEDG